MTITRSSELTGLDLATAAKLIADREITSVELTQACLDRIYQVGATLACFREIDAEDALRVAREADQQQAAGKSPGPLHGVPLAHKDIFYRAGKTVTAGSPILKDFKPDYDATLIRRLQHAGAITLGSLQSAEFAMSPTGANAHFEPVRNPWNLDYAPGGSSVGSGAAVAARLVFGSVGTDTGGSVRHPAALCGVIGIKPTQGRVSCHGVFPLAPSHDCPGILARTARDAALMLAVIAGPDPADPGTEQAPVDDYQQYLDGHLGDIRIGIPRQFYHDDIDPELERLVSDSRVVLTARGASCIPVDVPDMEDVNRLARIVFSAEAYRTHKKWLIERPGDYSDNVRTRIGLGKSVGQVEYEYALALRHRVQQHYVETAMQAVDLLHLPAVPVQTPTIESEATASSQQALEVINRFTRCTRTVNYLGLPAISVPCGFTKTGLPAAFQLVGRPFDEKTLLRVADAYQRDTGWHRMVPGCGATAE